MAPHCPTCRAPISLAALRKRMSGALLLSLPSPGIRCDTCGAKLKLICYRSSLAVLGALILMFAILLRVGVPPHRPLTILQFVACAPLFLAYRYSQLLAQVQPTSPGESLNYSADPLENLEDRTELKRKRASEEALEEADRLRSIADPQRIPWTCPTCTSDNPATFDMCWKCNASRPGSGI